MIVDGQPRPYFDGLQWPSLAVCANLPATAVPTGRFAGGSGHVCGPQCNYATH